MILKHLDEEEGFPLLKEKIKEIHKIKILE
jgi:hypothetical protein